MKTNERNRLISIYGPLYKRYEFERMPGSFGCFYCGEPPGTVDHMPPLSSVDLRNTQEWRKDGVALLTVPCCTWCNARLANRLLFTPYERAQYIEAALLRKYDRDSVLWADDEISEMSKEFQRTIKAKQNAVKNSLMRVRAAQWRTMREIEAIEHGF